MTKNIINEFKEFALKGNMVDMAIGIVIGAAFGTVVRSLVDDIIMPIVAGLIKVPNFANLFLVLRAPENTEGVNMESIEAVRQAGGVALGYGLFINAFIAFLLVAIALFFVVRTMNHLQRKKEEEAPKPEAPKGPTQEELLTEIRDLLKEGR